MGVESEKEWGEEERMEVRAEHLLGNILSHRCSVTHNDTYLIIGDLPSPSVLG